VVNALFAVWVETEIGGTTKNLVPKGINALNSQVESMSEKASISEFAANINSTEFGRGGIIAQGMGEGQKLHSFDTKRPTANFEQFVTAVKRSLYSAKGMSIAVADYNFNGSYSAARGELLVFWNRVMTLRYDHMTDYEDLIYQMWISGEIENENIKVSGWDDETTRDAWCNAYWVGPSRPDIDPESSAKAHEIESKHAWKTDAEISAERSGTDWSENADRKLSENETKAKFNADIVKLDKTTYSISEAKTESKSTSITEGA
jgi:capsid protein